MVSKTIQGFIRKLDRDGTVRVRERDDIMSPVVFEGAFNVDFLEVAVRAFRDCAAVVLHLGPDGSASEIVLAPPLEA